jgi:DNA polymerase-1
MPAAAPSSRLFRECWVINFEFYQPKGENPKPLCFTAIEKFSGRTIKLWRDELLRWEECPFDLADDVLVCSYSVVAEIACFLALGWKLPRNVLCLFSEHRVTTNGLVLPFTENDLASALAVRGSAHLTDKAYRERQDTRAGSSEPYAVVEQAALLDHCFCNTQAALRLLDLMMPTIKWQRARFFGRFSAAVAKVERRGTPLAMEAVHCLIENRVPILHQLVAEVDKDFGVYEGLTLKRKKFLEMTKTEERQWDWPMRADGIWPALDKETFEMMENFYPVHELRQLIATISQLRDVKLAIGADGRNRCSLKPFTTKTARCAPSTTQYIWAVAKWMRRLVRPSGPRMALGYLDYSSEEFLVAACLSGDEHMQQAYYAGDPYMGVGIALGLAPRGATGASHPQVRTLMKVLILGLGYGMKAHGLQRRTGLSLTEAKDIMRQHKRVFARFWEWCDDWQAESRSSRVMQTPLGWEMRIRGLVTDNTIQNWPVQSCASDIFRVLAVAADDAGLATCALIHDAVVIEEEESRIEDAVAAMRDCMIRAGRAVIGADLDVGKPQIVRFPDRFYDKDGEPMYRKVTVLLPEIAA